VRVVPRVEREEFVNAGVILFCAERRWLGCRLLERERLGKRLAALAPAADADEIARHLAAIAAVCAGETAAGSIGTMSASERFHWLVAPRSTVIQVGPVHSGLCEDPQRDLYDLFERMVRSP
jgi:hypothetical protein